MPWRKSSSAHILTSAVKKVAESTSLLSVSSVSTWEHVAGHFLFRILQGRHPSFLVLYIMSPFGHQFLLAVLFLPLWCSPLVLVWLPIFQATICLNRLNMQLGSYTTPVTDSGLAGWHLTCYLISFDFLFPSVIYLCVPVLGLSCGSYYVPSPSWCCQPLLFVNVSQF